MKTLVGVNTLTNIDQPVYANHCQFWFRLGRTYPKDDFVFCTPKRMSIDRMRNFCAQAAMELECDYLMFIDDDVVVDIDAWGKLQRENKDVISGITYIRGYPFHPMVFKFEEGSDNFYMDDYREKIGKDGLVHCDAVGFSCVLISVELLKKLEPPYFLTGPNFTEDVYFCKKARELIPNLDICAHPLVETAHGLGNDYLLPGQVPLWKAFLETRDKLQSGKIPDDRGTEFVKREFEDTLAKNGYELSETTKL